MIPQKYSGNKINKRDFHNWKNKIDQIVYLLNQTVYIETDDDKIYLKTGTNSFSSDNKRLDRSVKQKKLYFENHNVEKTPGFELHHVVPLAWAESQQHFKLLDDWLNLVYIDAFSHAKITQNKNRNVLMSNDNKNIILSDNSRNNVYLKQNENILYAPNNLSNMLVYNDKLININI